MPRSPNWENKDPSTTQQVYWTSTWTPSNPASGYTTNSTTVTNPNFIKERGERSYAVTPGFNGPTRPFPIPPLGFTATFERQYASGQSRSYERGIVGSNNGNVEILLADTNTIFHNVFQIGFIVSKIDASLRSEVDAKARNKCLSELKGMSINLAQATAERKMTAHTVASTAKAIAGTISNLRKGNFTGAAKALGINPPKRGKKRFNRDFANDAANAASNGWLALQYGWKPLLQDVYGACEALAKANNRNTVFSYVSGSGLRSFTEEKASQTKASSGWTGDTITVQTYEASYRVKYKLRFSKSSAPISTLASVGITNPALLAWELMPYSFVIDWFLPVGNWLSSLDATLGLQFQSGFSVSLRREKFNSSRSRNERRLTGSVAFITSSGQESKDYTEMRRVTLSSFPSASFPRFKNPVSTNHVISAMALLKQLKR